jgi:hypothetical protein
MSTTDQLNRRVFDCTNNQDITIGGVGPQSVEAWILVFVLARSSFTNRAPMTHF